MIPCNCDCYNASVYFSLFQLCNQTIQIRHYSYFVRQWHKPLLMSVSEYDGISPSASDYVYFFIFHMHGEFLLLFGWLVSTHVWDEPCVIFHNFHTLCVCVVGKTLLSTALVPTFFLHVGKHAEQHHHRLSSYIYIYLTPFLFSPLWPSETSHNLPPSLPCQWCRHSQELFLISPTSWATPRVTWSWTRNPVPIRINTEIWAAPPMCLNPAAAPLEYWCVHAGRLGGEREGALLSYLVDSWGGWVNASHACFHLYSVVREIILFIYSFILIPSEALTDCNFGVLLRAFDFLLFFVQMYFFWPVSPRTQ